MSNRKIIHFNDIYNRLYVAWSSGADDAMLLEVSKGNIDNKPDKTEFKLEHIWYILRHQSKWCVRHNDDDSR